MASLLSNGANVNAVDEGMALPVMEFYDQGYKIRSIFNMPKGNY